jgi:MscS family membrane protein
VRLATTISIEYRTTYEQMLEVLAGLERVLREHPRIWPDDVRVQLARFADSSLDIEVMAWFEAPSWVDFLQCRQDVLLGFMKVVEDAGTDFAFPTRTVHLVSEPTPQPAKEPA